MSEEDMQNDFKEFREVRSLCYAVELFGVPHWYLQRFLRTGQDKLSKNKHRQTMFSSEQDEKLSRIVKPPAHGFRLGYNNDPIFPKQTRFILV